MSNAKAQKNSKRNDRIFPVLLLLVAASIVYFTIDEEAEHKTVSAVVSQQAVNEKRLENEKVNKHLYFTNQKMEIERKRAELFNSKAPRVGDTIWPSADRDKSYGVDLSPDSAEASTYQDLNRDKKELRYFAPRAQVQGEIYDRDKMQEANDEYKQEYARQFLQNALNNGYEVTLDENYRVIGVKPVKRPPAAVMDLQDGMSQGQE